MIKQREDNLKSCVTKESGNTENSNVISRNEDSSIFLNKRVSESKKLTWDLEDKR